MYKSVAMSSSVTNWGHADGGGQLAPGAVGEGAQNSLARQKHHTLAR